MRIRRRTTFPLILAFSLVLLFLLSGSSQERTRFPYARFGLTERQAAAHLLDRFTYGPRPGDIESVARTGLDRWFDEQLTGRLPDRDLNDRLTSYSALSQSAEEIARTYPNTGFVLQAAYEEGIIQRGEATDREELQNKLRDFSKEKGFRPVQELTGQLLAQKTLRAYSSENQLREVLTEFWFNHFNVSLSDNQSRPYVLSYERDAIRPNAAGRFVDLLKATAKHPAMLTYLNNAQSTAGEGALTTMEMEFRGMEEEPGLRGRVNRAAVDRARKEYAERAREAMEKLPKQAQRRRGLNENYARELMELHTLGVDGGYTQEDVVEVARAFTGWTIMPPGQKGDQLKQRIDRGRAVGFVQDGGFLFRADAHDAGSKAILGVTFPSGGGIEDGERVLEMLARHPATAKFISRSIAIRFVSDDPPKALIDRMAEIFLASKGDIGLVMHVLVESPEFWSPASRRAKIKSPFELAISAVRGLGAHVETSRGIVSWTSRMGQPMYACQAPTGYPDRASQWINSGSLLNRMNYGFQLASGRVQGVRVDLELLTDGREPGSPDEALAAYTKALLPERSADSTVALLQRSVRSTELRSRIEEKEEHAVGDEGEEPEMFMDENGLPLVTKKGNARRRRLTMDQSNPPTMQQHIVGLIIGSPEFQRR